MSHPPEAGEPSVAEQPRSRTMVRLTGIVIGLVALVLALWWIYPALLLAFGGVLLAVFLRGLARPVHRWTGLSMAVGTVAVAALLLVLVVGGAVAMGAAMGRELSQLSQTLQEGVQRVREMVAQLPWGESVLSAASEGVRSGTSVLGQLPAMLGKTVEGALSIVVVAFAGLYLAVSPQLYVEGAVRLFPRHRQARIREVLHACGRALWLWLMGRAVVMLLVALVTSAGLLLVGVPLAVPLGVIAGLLEFVPFFGSIVAGIPIVLVALTVDPTTAVYALLLVLAIQQTEGNLFEPLVEKKAVSVPPALILVAAIAFTLLFGIAGAVFATPLLVVLMVGVKMLYQQDVLGEPVKVPGTPGRRA
ncbi:AI-2E family transporter [Ramlibacter sp. AW1]|uniref:AI-2E family transporter n=1 Tax=Ramlibacter aurantiacus TaxID=2801330 RepID=A0A937D5A8_9BURK|nr:AI-2E family transporter [Ramlibacter aurantiacus]MBL0419708.1 AI-2E family transporter [Ramlibacter aurantiacus]